MPPLHILNAPTRLMKNIGYGDGYQYDPDTPEGFSGADYFPEGMDRETFYHPTTSGYEEHISRRLDRWSGLRGQRPDLDD
jgi:putative ATPase